MAVEDTPLLSHRPRTPLPKLQFSLILLAQVSEPLTSMSIFPYVNQLVSELDITGGDEKKVGYYAGLESLFFLTETMTVLQWSRASDYVGRKPILLIGLFGTALSILSFGLSRTFWMLVLSRCLCGLLCGNMGVMKSTMADLTDRTNRAQGFALVPITWALGTNPNSTKLEVGVSKVPARRPLPLRKILRYPAVVLSVSNYVMIAFLNTSYMALFPLFATMPVEIGGLGLSPPTIGFLFSIYGVITGCVQVFLFAPLVNRFGEKRVFLGGIASCLPIYSLFPIMSGIARQYGFPPGLWALVGCSLVCCALMDIGFSAIFLYITASVPRSSRGTANGLSQTSVSLARAIAPALATSLFSFSVEYDVLGGYFVYLVFIGISALALVLAARLPKEVWDDSDD
ncbi:MFS general substrate transporter [Roridomyces roridus]|uniref:MFS general substrate transporter n=1 Tax=Roridomyces roridus TaxID=1738132 RepID=A0AAD7FYX1_9AGAR|nr:MFS general substrate transporter [Roridomyces roridus]